MDNREIAIIFVTRVDKVWVITTTTKQTDLLPLLKARGREPTRFFYYLNEGSLIDNSDLEAVHLSYLKNAKNFLSYATDLRNLELNSEFRLAFDVTTSSIETYRKFAQAIEPYRVINDVYSIDDTRLRNLCQGVLEEIQRLEIPIFELGGSVLEMLPINKKDACYEALRAVRQKMDILERDLYLPYVYAARDFFKISAEFRRVEETVRKVFVYERKTGLKSFLDGQLKSVLSGMEEIRKRYGSQKLPEHINISVVAIGAFGYQTNKSLVYLALQRILQKNIDLNDRHNWVEFDLVLYLGFKYHAGAGDVCASFYQMRYWSTSLLVNVAPVRELIPEGFSLSAGNSDCTDIPHNDINFHGLGRDSIYENEEATIRNRYGLFANGRLLDMVEDITNFHKS
jgi:hypothetical protein